MMDPEHLYLHDVYEPEVTAAVHNFLRPGDCAIDVGAGIGFFSAMMGRIVGPEGLVLAFEPEAASFTHLARNIHLVEKLNNVACLKMALWNGDREMKLWSCGLIGYSSMHNLYYDSWDSETVEARMLDGLLGEENHPKFIKVDCEGGELEVLHGASRILQRGVDCIIVEMNSSILKDTNRDRVIRYFMADLGYDMFLISIGDGNGNLIYPIKVAPGVPIELKTPYEHEARMINVMFSTEAKVKEYWVTPSLCSGDSARRD